ncbi:DUF1015 domain-containing protein [Flavobacterium longum]|uniref:DUF1015 domain-containing protein n=1 Tax=Flavobacterium longum TaxID=1299340 RepID=UPI0039E7675B
MAQIIPFQAVRPTRDKVSLVTSRSYDEYSPAELAAQLEFNPLSFLHVLNPAYTNQQKTAFEKRFRLVHQKYAEFKQEGILVQDEKPAVYIHKIVSKTHTFTGIIVGTSIADYKSDVIKRHEDTLQYRVELFKDYLKFSGFNTEPVLMTYPDNDKLSDWLDRKTKTLADFEFSTTRKDVHYLWKIDDENDIALLQKTFSDIGNIYIADGHHRSASAEMLYDEQPSAENHNYFMSFLIADSNVKIYEYNRLIKDLNGLSKSEFLKKLSEYFLIEIKSQQLFHPNRKHEFGMYLDGEFYALTLMTEKCGFESPLDRLDAQILYNKVLSPILGIADLRNDERIEYLPGKLPVTEIMKKVDDGEFELGFILFPSAIDEIKAIADAHQIMPPKSTYIEPKFRSGLVVYEL